MNIRISFISVLLIYLSISSNLSANPFPVYFADVIKEDGKEFLHFEWRSDYKSYDKAVITNERGKILGEVLYPDNMFDIQEYTALNTLFVTAVGINGEKSEPIKVDLNKDNSSLYASGPTEQIIIKKQRGKNARFVGTQSGAEFIAKGVNFCGIRLSDHDSFEPDIIATQVHVDRIERLNSNPAKASFHDVSLGDRIQFYDPYRTEILMRTLKSNGYNLVRVFVKPGGRGSETTNIRGMSGSKDTKGLSAAYMDNFIDFLIRARKYGIYVMPCFTENEMLDNDYFKALSKGNTKQGILFSEVGIKAKQHYIESVNRV
jgi:hypothetical protein